MMASTRMLIVLFCTLSLAGCASKLSATPAEQRAPTEVEAGAMSAGAPADAATASGLGAAGADGAGVAGPQGGLLSRRVVYFDFDRAELRGEDAAIVNAHAAYLSGNPGTRVRLEGHTDERGTREYNIGLAERRAQAVRRAMMLQGVAENQLSTVSFGEERPAVVGDDETAWSQNRRVEIIYLN
jgi:peptidoglycan-associated lipoprotein